MSVYLKDICAIEVLDSRASPGVAVQVTLSDGSVGRASVPSGTSTGEYEAIELRDGDASMFRGRGVKKAVANINGSISDSLSGIEVLDIESFDRELLDLDPTPYKEVLGSNATLGVSLALANALAVSRGIELFELLGTGRLLPVPLVAAFNGGALANNSLDLQDISFVPHRADSFSDSIRIATECYLALGDLLQDDGYSTAVGDEGGYAPQLESTELAFEFALKAIERSGFLPGEHVSLAVDVAAGELLTGGSEEVSYFFRRSSGKTYSSESLIEMYSQWIERYSVCSLEDPLGENDWLAWKNLTKALGDRAQLVGDDLFSTRVDRVVRGGHDEVANAVMIKPNQIGTLSESIAAISSAKEFGYKSILSHRSGESIDTSIADLCVSHSSGQIKAGSVCRGERVAKYNRLLWIEKLLGAEALFENPFNYQ